MPDLHRALAVHENLRRQLLEQFRELADDEETLTDTLEGISPLPDMIAALLRSSIADKLQAEALNAHITKLHARQQRIHARHMKKRELALQYAQEAGLKRIPAPDFTASVVTPEKGAVAIPDETVVPDAFWKVSKSLNRAEICVAVDAEGGVAWAYRGNPKPYWSISER